MNERTSERMHERANEGTGEATRERRNERARTLVSDRLENLRVSLLVVVISFSGSAAVAAGQSYPPTPEGTEACGSKEGAF